MLKEQKLNKVFSLIIFCGCLTVLRPVIAQEAIEKTIIEEESVQEKLPPLPDYTWTDFLTNKDCRPFIKELATRPEYNEIYQNLRHFCLDEKLAAWDYLLNTFRKEKRKLLFAQTMNDTTSYIKYLKVVPYLLFDIQNTKPFGNQPMAILDKTEQAIVEHQLDTALSLINELPDTWKNELKNSQVICERLLKLKEQFYDLNESKEGGQDD